jgi:hypothetical protein
MHRLIPRAVLALGLAVAVTACDDDPVGPGDLPAPTTVVVTQLSLTSVRVSWSRVQDAESYLVERASADNPGVFAELATPTDTFVVDDAVMPGVAYSYRVSSAAGGETGSASSVQTITTGVAVATINATITADRTLRQDTVYTLSGYVQVTNGATVTIEPGTRIIGDPNTLGSSLWILRGAKILALGTADAPIVFTSGKAEGSRAPGDWGGIIIIGNGRINRTGVAEIFTEGPAEAAVNYAGGTDNADSSGVLRYVRIEFAGYDVTGTGQELNSLSMYAAGSGTKLEYVQSMSGLDDSFEWWGGAVQGRYLVSFESGDDHFDWSEGFAGKLQYLIAFQSQRLVPAPGSGIPSSDPRGFEADGCDPDVPACSLTATSASEPYSNPTIANFTLVGTQETAFPSDGRGMVLRRGTGGMLHNGIVARYKGVGCQMRDAWTDSLRLRDSLNVQNVIFADNAGGNYAAEGTTGVNDFCKASSWNGHNHIVSGAAAADIFKSLNTASLDFQPVSAAIVAPGGGKVALPAARSSGFFGGTMTDTDYIGAVDPNATSLWFDGWTTYRID